MRPGGRTAILFSVKLLVSLALLGLVVSRAGASRTVDTLAGIRPAFFAGAVLVYLAAQFLCSIRWGLLLGGEHSLRRLFPLYLMGSFFNRFLPGLVGGDAVKAYYFHREAGGGSRTVASVFMDRYIGFCSLMLLGLAAYPFAVGHLRDTWVLWALPVVVLTFLAGSVFLLGLRPGRRFGFLADTYGHVRAYRRKGNVLLRAGAVSLLVQAAIVLIVLLVSRGLGQKVPVAAFFVFLPIITAVSTLPVSIAGVGVREAAFVTLFATLGMEPEQAVAMSFAYFLAVTAGGLGGLYEYLRFREHAARAP